MEEIKHKLMELDPNKEYFLFIDESLAESVLDYHTNIRARVWVFPTLKGELLDREMAKKFFDDVTADQGSSRY